MAENDAPAAVEYQTGPVEVTLPGVAVVGVKLLGLYALLLATTYLVYIPALFISGGRARWAEALIYALPAASYIAAGIVLLFGSEWVVARILGVSHGGLPPTSFDEHFQAMAFSIVGVLLIVWGAAGGAQAVANYAAEQGLIASGLVPDGGWDFTLLAEPAVELVGGLVLFLRGRGLAALWHRMRYGGIHAGDVGPGGQ